MLEPENRFLSLDAIAERDLGQRGVVDPALEEALERSIRLGFHRVPQVFGPGLLIARLDVEAPHAAEERVVADQPAEHLQHRRALVVDERAEYAAIVSDVAEAIAQVDRSLIGFLQAPLAPLPEHLAEDLRSAPALGVQTGEKLREAFAEPLLVVVLPTDRLAPPLMRELVREEELREALEVRGVRAPDERGVG